MTPRARTLPAGEPRVQWTTRNLPIRLLTEARLIAAMTELLAHPRSVEAIVNGALEVGLPAVRRTVEREVKAAPPSSAPARNQRPADLDEP
jgi:hypothetical protein